MPPRDLLAVILDGVGDRPHPDFDHQTPLQAAQTPTLDALARRGSCGVIDPLAPGLVPGSGTGHLGLFDYEPLSPQGASPNRGPLEALGLGFEPREGRVAIRGNFCTLDDEGRIQDRRAGRFKTDQDQAEAEQLIEAMNADLPEGVSFHYHPRMGYRFVVLLEEASPAVTDTDPGGTGLVPRDPKPTDGTPRAKGSASRLREALKSAREVLQGHPVNEARRQRGAPPATGMVTRGAGTLERGHTLGERFGIASAAVAGGNAYRGIAAYMGMTLVDVEGATGDLRTDYGAKVRAALDALGENDLVYLHIKSPDICGENGDFEAKRSVLEEIDGALGPLLDRDELVLGLTGDHSTPCTRGAHSGDPVPLILSAPDGRVDDVARFDEASCARGGLGRLRGGDFLRSMLDMADRTKKQE